MWKQKLITLAGKKSVAVGAASVFSALAGATTATLILARRMDAKYQIILDEEIEKAKLFYKKYYKAEEFGDPASTLDPDEQVAVEKAVDAMHQYDGTGVDSPAETEDELIVRAEKVEVNIFEQGGDVPAPKFDVEREVENRSPDTAYIISYDEYYENEPDHEQTTITYYDGDEVLADAADIEIPDLAAIGGAGNLSFGYGSNDENIVYVRNEKMSMDFEIARSGGKYSIEVLGLQVEEPPTNKELKHSTRRKIRSSDE